MDGNNRWSNKKSCSKYYAYKKGANNLIKLSDYIFNNTKTKYISAFALSINNLKRPHKVLNMIEKVLIDSLRENEDRKFNFDIQFIGNFKFLDHKTQKIISKLNKDNKHSKKLYIYLSYGGREDIENAAINLKSGKNKLKNYLSTSKLPDPDILIRTGGYIG